MRNLAIGFFSALASSPVFAANSSKTFYVKCQAIYYIDGGVSFDDAVSRDVDIESATTSPVAVSIPFAGERITATFEGFGTTINAWQPTFSAGIYDAKEQGLAAEKAVSYASDLDLGNRPLGKVVTLTGRSMGKRTVNSTPVDRVDYECSLIRKK